MNDNLCRRRESILSSPVTVLLSLDYRHRVIPRLAVFISTLDGTQTQRIRHRRGSADENRKVRNN